MKVGFIGLGRMGQAMASRVLGGGHDLVVYNRTPAKAEALGQTGATVAQSIGAAAAGRDVVITMLSDDVALEEVTLGTAGAEDGLLHALPDAAIHLAMGTHGVDMTRTMAKVHADAGRAFVAAPVLGRPDVAEKGQLGIVPGGAVEAVERCRPLFDVIGRRTFEAGAEPEAAASIKVANNLVLGCAIEVMGEGFSLVRKFGVTPEVFYEVLTDGLFSCPAYKIYGEIIAQEDYDRVGVTATLGLKDSNLALAAGQAVGVPLPSVNVWRDRLLGAITHGDGEKDWSVVANDQARASALE